MHKKPHIFLIDDDEDDQDFFSMAIEEVSALVDFSFANDGVHALQMLKTNDLFIPHIVFIDINMPRMNGIECLGEIRKLPRLHHIPVYMYSTSAEPSIVEQCQDLGALGFIRKEPNIEILQKIIMQVLSNHQLISS